MAFLQIQYLIVGDTAFLHNPLYEPFCKPNARVGEFEGIQVFKIMH